MLKVRKDAIKVKTSEGNMQSAGVLCSLGVVQSDGTTWKETEITSSISNVYDLMMAIVGGELKNNTCYCAMLSNIKEAEYQYNQVVAIVVYAFNGRFEGVGLRYRNENLGQVSFNTSYDAYADIGTIYKWVEMEV